MNGRQDESASRSPVPADRQERPPPERPTTPQEDAGQDLAQLDDPPQAEGDRDDAPG
jgi:hypothetical protein